MVGRFDECTDVGAKARRALRTAATYWSMREGTRKVRQTSKLQFEEEAAKAAKAAKVKAAKVKAATDKAAKDKAAKDEAAKDKAAKDKPKAANSNRNKRPADTGPAELENFIQKRLQKHVQEVQELTCRVAELEAARGGGGTTYPGVIVRGMDLQYNVGNGVVLASGQCALVVAGPRVSIPDFGCVAANVQYQVRVYNYNQLEGTRGCARCSAHRHWPSLPPSILSVSKPHRDGVREDEAPPQVQARAAGRRQRGRLRCGGARADHLEHPGLLPPLHLHRVNSRPLPAASSLRV